jgi:hypothetical protein
LLAKKAVAAFLSFQNGGGKPGTSWNRAAFGLSAFTYCNITPYEWLSRTGVAVSSGQEITIRSNVTERMSLPSAFTRVAR